MSNHTQNNDWVSNLVKLGLSKLPPIYTALVTIALIFLGFQQPNLSTCEAKIDRSTQNQLQQQHNSRVDYERLKIGMTQLEVESILGRGIETERSLYSITLIWKNADESSIKVIFEHDKLKSKYQENLE